MKCIILWWEAIGTRGQLLIILGAVRGKFYIFIAKIDWIKLGDKLLGSVLKLNDVFSPPTRPDSYASLSLARFLAPQ